MNGSRLKLFLVVLSLHLAVWCCSAWAATIRSIEVRGNTAFTARELLDRLSSKPQLPYNEAVASNDAQRVREAYLRRGFLAAEVGHDVVYADDTAYVDVVFTITEGRQTVIGAIAVHGNQYLPAEELLRQFDLRPGGTPNESVLERDLENLLLRYERAGYPFAQCRVERLVVREGKEEDSLDIIVAIDEGPRVTIDEIRVEGNRETDPAVVVRETRIAEGEVFNPTKVDAIKSRLKRLNIFSDVSDPELYVRNDRNGLLIKVQEGSTNTFDGVLGYLPGRTAGESGYIAGLVSLAMRNLFGTGRKLSFRWAREDRFSQELAVRYLEPWVFQLPANIGGGFLQRQQDSSYVRRALDVKAELMLSEELSLAGVFTSESIIPSARDTLYSRVFQSSIVSFGGELVYDTRDDAYSPTAGARYRTDYQYGRKRFSNVPAALTGRLPARVSVQRFTFDLDFYLATFTRQVLAVGVHGRELQSGHPEEGEMFRFGGSRSLRGFRENQFLGSRIGWTNTEYRFLLARRSFFYGFLDAGYYLRPADDVRGIGKADAFKYGYGIGVQVETGLGVLGVSFALGSDTPSFSNGTVHFGLINEF